MSATAKQYGSANAATRELWRIAESGEVDELGRVFLRGAYINGRNEHGMTALMRAAYYGHARMVRALLERGADPNLARSDKFTALALAAFFGHTETVKILIEHGAKAEVVTRCGASAQMWATRRTFVEAARCLEAPAPATAAAPVVVPAPAPAPVVKTLKDPPEIWDLVQEAPRNFTARSAFVSRLKSMKASFALRIAAVVIVAIAGAVGMWVLRGSQARNLPLEAPSKQSVVATEVSAPANVESTKSETPAGPSTPEVNEFSHHSEPAVSDSKASRKVVLTRQSRSRVSAAAEPVILESREAPAATAPVVTTAPKVEPRKSSNTPNNSLSPQLIAPAKPASPKGKVIQWP